MGNSKQLDGHSLRAATAATLTDLLAGHRTETGIHASTLTRMCDGSIGNPLERLILMLRAVPDTEAAALLGAVEDAYDEAHGEPAEVPLAEALLAADASDSADDVARGKVAIRGATEADLHELIRATYAQDHDSGVLRRAARRELRRRFAGPVSRPRKRPAASRGRLSA